MQRRFLPNEQDEVQSKKKFTQEVAKTALQAGSASLWDDETDVFAYIAFPEDSSDSSLMLAASEQSLGTMPTCQAELQDKEVLFQTPSMQDATLERLDTTGVLGCQTHLNNVADNISTAKDSTAETESATRLGDQETQVFITRPSDKPPTSLTKCIDLRQIDTNCELSAYELTEAARRSPWVTIGDMLSDLPCSGCNKSLEDKSFPENIWTFSHCYTKVMELQLGGKFFVIHSQKECWSLLYEKIYHSTWSNAMAGAATMASSQSTSDAASCKVFFTCSNCENITFKGEPVLFCVHAMDRKCKRERMTKLPGSLQSPLRLSFQLDDIDRCLTETLYCGMCDPGAKNGPGGLTKDSLLQGRTAYGRELYLSQPGRIQPTG